MDDCSGNEKVNFLYRAGDYHRCRITFIYNILYILYWKKFVVYKQVYQFFDDHSGENVFQPLVKFNQFFFLFFFQATDGSVIVSSFDSQYLTDDSDTESYLRDPPSPCDVSFLNDNILINGRSNLSRSPKNRKVIRIQCNFIFDEMQENSVGKIGQDFCKIKN